MHIVGYHGTLSNTGTRESPVAAERGRTVAREESNRALPFGRLRGEGDARLGPADPEEELPGAGGEGAGADQSDRSDRPGKGRAGGCLAGNWEAAVEQRERQGAAEH